ncbi:hypothetical protein L249_4192 [Ophiocordyceps polyrhachis-furcata BCC 54312]|uniref:BSD domain-containing protein n=1 Tax=Ophiocordyceps polyrhachis-furcata BCC 54312 TaxID=1330021 RepID=A0A367LBW0_9HYPO|nr:hypothetical protein L249_4192 [Ophiocordyceps polyrhachis-furcata BCC 54312]
MDIPFGRTIFKKKDGILSLTSDYETVIWTPTSASAPIISLPVSRISNLQQTPDSSSKVMLKIFEKADNEIEPATYLFHFYSSDARADAKAIKDVLSRLLANIRSNDTNLPGPSAETLLATSAPDPNSALSAPMPSAAAVNSQQFLLKWFDDGQLKVDIGLQQSLMKKDKSLYQTYMEAMRTKPESISGAAFNSQFWSTRINLLRAHAIEINQKKGAYNVLSTVKPRTVDGELKLNISVEQVQLILAQHPLVRRIYNENVPKLSESDFWSRFFLSRLSKSLRGERVTDSDRSDPLFDKYSVSDNTSSTSKISILAVPYIINLEANEENQGGFRTGNAKDIEMRHRTNMSIAKTLNSMSDKIMANVSPTDSAKYDEGRRNDIYGGELSLRDLKADYQENRIMLHIKGLHRNLHQQDLASFSRALNVGRQDPEEVLARVKKTVLSIADEGGNEAALHGAIDFDDDIDNGDERLEGLRVGSRAATTDAEGEVMKDIRQQRAQELGHLDDTSSPMGLPPPMTEKCSLTHATTIEFLQQFWNAFLSGDSDRAAELQYLAESLKCSEARIAAAAQEADAERDALIRKRKQEIRHHFEQTGKKIKWKSQMIGGGHEAVDTIMRPVLSALTQAQDNYSKALLADGLQSTTE